MTAAGYAPVTLSSARLTLRPISAASAEDYLPTYGNADAMAMLGGPWDLARCRDNARANELRWTRQGFASWLVDLIDEAGKTHCAVALLGFGDAKGDVVGFGWIVAPEYQRRGIARESSRLALDWFFANFDLTVLTETIPANEPSIAASAAMGFALDHVSETEYVCSMSRAQYRHDPRNSSNSAVVSSRPTNDARLSHRSTARGPSS